MSEELVIRCCAPTLASLKTGNLFNCRCDSCKALYESIRDLNRRLACKGLRVLPLRYHEGKALVYVYRPEKLKKDLTDDTARSLLRERGYPCENANRCVICLKNRLTQTCDFPHEIGLFLGYPPEDVHGFIHEKGKEKCSGCWKVYGDVKAAKRMFERFGKCTRVYLRHWRNGSELERLAVVAK